MSCILKFRSLKISLETFERSFQGGEKTEISREASWDMKFPPLVNKLKSPFLCSIVSLFQYMLKIKHLTVGGQWQQIFTSPLRRLIQQPLATSTAVNNCYLMGKGIGTQFNTNLEDQCLGSIFIYLSTCPVLVALPSAYIKLVDTRTRKPPHHTMVMFPIKVKLIHQAYK